MSVRILLCEGPDDIAALRELGTWLLGASVTRIPASAGAAGQERKSALTTKSNHRVDLIAASGKSKLPDRVATLLATLSPQVPGDPEETSDIGVVFDPDGGDPDVDFLPAVEAAIAAGAPGWTLSKGSGSWLAQRAVAERVNVHFLPWRGTTDPFDGLGAEQSLERLLCSIGSAAYPAEAKLVESWLDAFPSTRKRTWKSAVHLWCALVESDQNEATAPTRFLHQNKECKPHVRPLLERLGLLEPLRPLFE